MSPSPCTPILLGSKVWMTKIAEGASRLLLYHTALVTVQGEGELCSREHVIMGNVTIRSTQI